MKLRFHARGTGLVTVPGERRFVGQPPRYVGRKLVTTGEGENISAAFPAVEDAHEADSESEAGQRLMLIVRRGDLWPADEATAKACGVEFVPLKFSDGAWVPKPAPSSSKSKD